MSTTSNLKFIAHFTAMLLSVALLITSCSAGSDEEVTPSEQKAEISLTNLSNESGSCSITYSGDVGTAWSATLESDDSFISFSISTTQLEKSGTIASSGSNILWLYFKENQYTDNRTAEVTFTFEGAEPITFSLLQLSSSSMNSPYNSSDEPRWSEIPTKVDKDNYIYVVHTCKTTAGDEVRNFSICFDKDNFAAAWVAYPYHSIYDGDSGRNEDWGYDPKISTSYQPDLSAGSYNGSYDRGHQLPSADRQATDAMNAQTFYSSNMTPQLGTLNQQKWATLEATVRKQVCADTLFVVTGADFTTTIGTTTDKNGKVCPLPGAYFKVLLRTRAGYSGKSVSECSASELQAIGFWAEHRYYSSTISPVSVQYIEEMTGFNFFPNVPEEVKASYTAGDWSL